MGLERGKIGLFKNIGFHTELLTPLSIILMVIGGILGYGGKFIAGLIFRKPSDKLVLFIKSIGVVIVLAGMILIFRR